MYCIWIPDERAVEYSSGAIFFFLFFTARKKLKTNNLLCGQMPGTLLLPNYSLITREKRLRHKREQRLTEKSRVSYASLYRQINDFIIY